MRSVKDLTSVVAAAGLALAAYSTPAFAGSPKPGVSYGKSITQSDLSAWDIDISTSDGAGLPAGKGTVAQGKKLFAEKCAACHGEGANGGPQFGKMYGSHESMKTSKRKLNPGSMYPYAPILFDYVRRAMPMDWPQSLSNNEVYALTAYIYNLSGLVKDGDTVDANYLKGMKMPNRDAFIVDNRPDAAAIRCMENCKPL
ncbi:MAG: cytochrome c [Rhodospirillaceae bacterium]